MNLPTWKYDRYSDQGRAGETNPWATFVAYVLALPAALATGLGLLLLCYEIGYGVGLYQTSCSLNSGQPKCHDWRSGRIDQHVNGNLNLNVRPK